MLDKKQFCNWLNFVLFTSLDDYENYIIWHI